MKTLTQEQILEEASQALRDGGIAMTKLVDLVDKGLPMVSFLQYMDSMRSSVNAKTIQGIKK